MEHKNHIFHVEAGALTEVPIYNDHRRARNWLAVVVKDPPSPGGLKRFFQARAHGQYFYLTSGLVVGDVIEFGADYYTASGGKRAERWYGVITSVSDKAITIAHTDNMLSSEAFAYAATLTHLPTTPASTQVDVATTRVETFSIQKLATVIEELLLASGKTPDEISAEVDAIFALLRREVDA